MKMLIGGQKVDARDGRVFEVRNPVTGAVLDSVPVATLEDVREAVARARNGQRQWNGKTLYERAEILRNYSAMVMARTAELGMLLTSEMGKLIGDSMHETRIAAQQFTGYIEVANHFYGKVLPLGSCPLHPGRETDLQMVVREPLGVIVAIVPFNAPGPIFGQKVAPALIAGNSVIVKPPSENPLYVIRLVEMLLEAGVPGDAAQVVTGGGESVGQWLVTDPRVSGIFFTGSTEAGVTIGEAAARNIIPCCLELGGNDPVIVLEDADVDLAAKQVALGRIVNAGQVCASPKRLIVHRSLVQGFTDRLIALLKPIRVGDPTDPQTQMSCLISEKAARKVEEQVQHTVRQGAAVVYGGKRDGTFFEPTVLSGVTWEMDVARDMEIFGPVFPIIAVDSLDEAVEVANNTMYGLSSSVFSKDYRKALKVANSLEAGMVVVNASGFYINAEMPWGGVKKSGIGSEGMSWTLNEVTRQKTITLAQAWSTS